MDKAALNERCVALFQNPHVKLRLWHPRMFWNVGNLFNPDPKTWTQPKVDLCELEIMLSAAANEASICAGEVDQREQGRAEFIVRQVRGGMRPLLKSAS